MSVTRLCSGFALLYLETKIIIVLFWFIKSCQVNFICIASLTIDIVAKHLAELKGLQEETLELPDSAQACPTLVDWKR